MSYFIATNCVRQQVEQLGVRRRILAVVQVHRVDEAPAHHQGPEPVGDVAGEGRATRATVRLGPSRARRLKTGTGRTFPSLSGGTRYSCPLATAGSATGCPSSTRGPGLVRHLLLEHRAERDVPLGLLAEHGHRARLDRAVGLLAAGDDRPAEEGVEPVIVLLLVVVDQGMIVALAALQVHAQEQPADVAREDVRVALAVEQEPRRGAGGRVGPVGRQDLPRPARRRAGSRRTPGAGTRARGPRARTRRAAAPSA